MSSEGLVPHPSFHDRTGGFVHLSGRNRTAARNDATKEFEHGLVFSSTPLSDDRIFEVKLDKKISSWMGSVEIGVTTLNPDFLDPIPSLSLELGEETWAMTYNSLMRNGVVISENYGPDLDKLKEGDRVGVLRTSNGELCFFVNGVSQGKVPGARIPEGVFAFINLYGKCVQVTLTEDNVLQDQRILSNDLANEATASVSNPLNSLLSNRYSNNLNNAKILAESVSRSSTPPLSFANNDKIRFHERKGLLIKLSNNNRTCERRRPFDEFNNGVVMTHRPLRDNELLEIRIDRLVDKWSGSIEVGTTTHNPNTLEFPATMTNQLSGTMMMSGCGILTNGKGTRREYGNFNLDELKEGDRIGMIRKTGGNLHFYVNGLDQGIAVTRVPSPMWGVVDLYGMTVKVTIVDRDERDEQNLITRRNLSAREKVSDNNNKLLFHRNCGSHAAVINGGLTSHRPNASDEFNFGVVLTNRPLMVNEIFEVRLDKMVTKWAGSIEIGVTTHTPNELEFPSTMTNIRSGTWMMTGNGVKHNGTTIIDDYGHNLDKLKVGDRVAVVRKENETIHFFVNSEDQGPAATNVPERVYGVIDLYGQAAQATIIDLSDHRSPVDGFASHFLQSLMPSITGTEIINHLHQNGVAGGTAIFEPDQQLRFHHLHGRNARISNSGQTASRPNALGEFNDAIVMSNRPLKPGEHFEIIIERMVERWSGSIEVGATLIRPEDLEFPNTMTDIDYDTWMLSGSAIMQDGQTVRNGYCYDLDSLSVGSRLGMTRAVDGSLRYTINGEDQGVACENIPINVYAVIDLYGQCAQVSLAYTNPSSSIAPLQPPSSSAQPRENSLSSSTHMESSHVSLPVVVGDDVVSRHKFDPCKIGKSIELKNNDSSAVRQKGNFSDTFVEASHTLEGDDYFEIRIDEIDLIWAGSLKIGVTSDIENQSSGLGNISFSIKEMVVLDGSQVKKNEKVIKANYCTSLDRLVVNDKVGIRRTADGLLKFVVNREESQTSVVATDLPSKVWPFVDLCGATTAITITSGNAQGGSSSPYCGSGILSTLPSVSNVLQDSLEIAPPEIDKAPLPALAFHHENHGRNIILSSEDIATRTDSYNQGIVVTNRVLAFDEVFSVKLRRINPSRWSSSLMIGVISSSPDKIHFPVSALGLKKNSWILCGDCVFQNGVKFSKISSNLDDLRTNHEIGIQITSDNSVHLWINGVHQGPVINRLPAYNSYYGLLDLYGMCEEVKLIVKGKESAGEEEISLEELKRGNQTSSNSSSITEKTALILENSRNHCEYLSLCKRFYTSLGLPSFYFPHEDRGESTACKPICYCQPCSKIQGYEKYAKKGNPPKEYGTPVGWVKFPLRKNDSSISLMSTVEWHVAYHATKPAYIRKILDRGNLLSHDDLGLEQRKKKLQKSKEDVGDSPQFLFSPTLQYISHICTPIIFKDKRTRHSYEAKVALQLEVHPGSYKIGPPTAGSSSVEYDSHFKLEETEWCTKERGNTTITGILIFLKNIML